MNTFEYNANRQISQLQDRIKKLEEEILTVRIAEAEQRRCAEEALAKLSRYEQAVKVEGFVSSYPLKSTIVFAGNNDIPELRGLDDQTADILIILKEDV